MDASAHVLVVDDHREIRDSLARYLKRHELRVTAVESAAAARRALHTASVDLVVLDVMMPGEDGLELCRHLRETTRIPVILLTAMAEDTDRIVGLEWIARDDLAPRGRRRVSARARSAPVVRGPGRSDRLRDGSKAPPSPRMPPPANVRTREPGAAA